MVQVFSLKRGDKCTKQEDLKEVLTVQEKIKRLKKELKEANKKLRHFKYKLGHEGNNHWPVEPGDYDLIVKNRAKHVVNWQKEFIRYLGKNMADEVVANSEIRVYTTLLIKKKEGVT